MAIREAYAREQARATEEAREQTLATEKEILRIGNAALTRRLSTEEEIPRGREKKRCAATRAPAETPSTAPRIERIAAETTDDDAEVLPAKRVRGSAAATPLRPSVASLKKQLLCTTCKATYTSGHFCPTCETRLFVVDQPTPPPETNRDDEAAEEAALPSPAATTASDKPTVPVTPNIPKVKALTSPVRPEYAVTPTRKQITQQMCGESTASSSSDSDTDEDFSPDGAPVRNGAPVRSPVESDTEDDARPPPNDDTDDDLPLPPPVAKEEPDDDDEREFFTCSF